MGSGTLTKAKPASSIPSSQRATRRRRSSSLPGVQPGDGADLLGGAPSIEGSVNVAVIAAPPQ
jgi:hypothetical protein